MFCFICFKGENETLNENNKEQIVNINKPKQQQQQMSPSNSNNLLKIQTTQTSIVITSKQTVPPQIDNQPSMFKLKFNQLKG